METFTDDTVAALASFLSPHDMLSLALTCKRFGSKNGKDMKRMAAREASKSRGGREVRRRIDTISLIEVAARTVLHCKWTDEEKNALPRRGGESWIGLYIKSFYQYSVYHYSLINWLDNMLSMSRDQTKHQLHVQRGIRLVLLYAIVS